MFCRESTSDSEPSDDGLSGASSDQDQEMSESDDEGRGTDGGADGYSGGEDEEEDNGE
jgi:hypothetical protein